MSSFKYFVIYVKHSHIFLQEKNKRTRQDFKQFSKKGKFTQNYIINNQDKKKEIKTCEIHFYFNVLIIRNADCISMIKDIIHFRVERKIHRVNDNCLFSTREIFLFIFCF